MEDKVSGDLRVCTYLFFKEFSPQLGICGWQRPPQILVPLPNHVSPPASLDPRTPVGEGWSAGCPVRAGWTLPPPCTVTPAIGMTSEHLLTLWVPWAGPSHRIAHLALKSQAASWITRV